MQNWTIVTGGCGFIGRHLVRRLIGEGRRVLVIDNLSANGSDDERDCLPDEDCPAAMYSGLAGLDSMRHSELVDHVDSIFHLAALSRVGTSMRHPVAAYESNVLLTVEVLERMRLWHPRRMVFTSTGATGRRSPYSCSKLAAEDACRLYHTLYGVPVAVARLYNVFGPGERDTGPQATVTAIFARQQRAGQPLTVVGDGSRIRDFIHVEDAVTALLHAERNSLWPEDGTPIDVGTGRGTTIVDLAKLFGSPIQHVPDRAGEDDRNIADLRPLRDITGWTPPVRIHQYVRDLISVPDATTAAEADPHDGEPVTTQTRCADGA